MRRDQLAVRPGKRDGRNPFRADLAARHRHSDGDIVTFVPPGCDREIKR